MAHEEDQQNFSKKPYEFIISSIPKEEKVSKYDDWASTYDQDLVTDQVSWWQISSTKLFNLIKQHQTTSNPPLIIDAGCGTGSAGVLIRDLSEQASIPIKLVGYDYSAGMIEEARKKGVYDMLDVGDFFGKMPVEQESADFVICAGVFLEGHCPPKAMTPVLGHLKKGGLAVVTIRITSYETRKKEYHELIEEAGCVVIDLSIEEYLGQVKGAYLTIKKE